MINYNDGEWHFWSGGDRPIHPDSEIDYIYLSSGHVETFRGIAADMFYWQLDEGFVIFRVVKEYNETDEGALDD